MRRRQIIKGGLTASMIGLAGCGYTIEENYDIEQRKSEIQSLESTVSRLRSTVVEKEQRILEKERRIQTVENQASTLETEVKAKSTEVQSLEEEIAVIKDENSELEDEISNLQKTVVGNVKQRIETLYENGVRFRDIGLEEWNTASDNYNDENYIQAARSWAYAYSHYDGAAEFFSLAGTLADNNGYDTAFDTISSANSYVLEIRDAADDFSLAAHYYAGGDTTSGDEYISQGNEHVDNADIYTVAPLTEVQQELGI